MILVRLKVLNPTTKMTTPSEFDFKKNKETQLDLSIIFQYGGFLKSGYPKIINLVALSIINHPFGGTSIHGNPHIAMGQKPDILLFTSR